MESVFVLVLVACSSSVLLAVGRRRAGGRLGVGKAAAWALEAAGLGVVLYLVNVAVGIALTAAARLVSGRFVSLYHAADPVLVALSLLQAVVLLRAWDSRRGA